jgi:glycosyltransferase involved in cell wall biosynthesis
LLAFKKPSTMPRLMTDVLLVSKPLAPPWHDSSKNLVRDLASHMRRYTPVVLSRKATELGLALPRAQIERIYSDAGSFSPALRDNTRVLARLLVGRKTALWHFFFAPNPKTSGAALWSSRLRRARTLQTVCSAPAPNARLDRVLFADHVVVLSEHTRQRCLQAALAPDRISLIPPAIVPLTPKTREESSALRLELGLPIDRPIVVYAGDLEFGRGAELALEAHVDLPRTLHAELVLACRAKTPNARAREAALRQRVAQLGVSDSVRFLGETTRIHDVLAVADLVTLPTDTLYAKMDLPLVLIEAMSLERCVLIGTGTPAEELAAAGGAVLAATQRDAVSAVTRRLLEDAAERALIGRRAREVVLCDYDPERMSARYEALYDQLCA